MQAYVLRNQDKKSGNFDNLFLWQFYFITQNITFGFFKYSISTDFLNTYSAIFLHTVVSREDPTSKAVWLQRMVLIMLPNKLKISH